MVNVGTFIVGTNNRFLFTYNNTTLIVAKKQKLFKRASILSFLNFETNNTHFL